MDNLSKSDPTCTFKVEQYMRVLSRQEVEKLAGEGVDVQQYINSLLRQIEGQKRHIARLEATCQRYAEAMEDEGHV